MWSPFISEDNDVEELEFLVAVPALRAASDNRESRESTELLLSWEELSPGATARERRHLGFAESLLPTEAEPSRLERPDGGKAPGPVSTLELELLELGRLSLRMTVSLPGAGVTRRDTGGFRADFGVFGVGVLGGSLPYTAVCFRVLVSTGDISPLPPSAEFFNPFVALFRMDLLERNRAAAELELFAFSSLSLMDLTDLGLGGAAGPLVRSRSCSQANWFMTDMRPPPSSAAPLPQPMIPPAAVFREAGFFCRVSERSFAARSRVLPAFFCCVISTLISRTSFCNKRQEQFTSGSTGVLGAQPPLHPRFFSFFLNHAVFRQI